MVREVSLEEIRDLYAILGNLEALASFLAMPKIKEKDIEEMRRLTEKMNEAIEKRNYRLYDELQLKFHNVYVSQSGNKELQILISSLKKRFIMKSYLRVKDDVLLKTLKIANMEHQQIVELIQRKDRRKLERFLKEVHWTIHTPALL